MTKMVKKEIVKRFHTLNHTDVQVFNGVAYLRVNKRQTQMSNEELRQSFIDFKKILKAKHMVKDVVLEGFSKIA